MSMTFGKLATVKDPTGLATQHSGYIDIALRQYTS